MSLQINSLLIFVMHIKPTMLTRRSCYISSMWYCVAAIVVFQSHHGIIAKLFADDVKIYLIIKNDFDVSKLQTALDLIADWANDWQLSVSVDKCSVLKIGCGTAVDADFILSGNVLPILENFATASRRYTGDIHNSTVVGLFMTPIHRVSMT